MATELTDTQTDRSSLSVDGQCFEITHAVSFEAAHFMGDQPEGHAYRNVHGHSFRLEATVSGRVQPGLEWVQDFAEMSAILNGVAAELDHKLLNDIGGLEVPTLERICVWVADRLRSELPGLKSVAIARPSLNEHCKLVLAA